MIVISRSFFKHAVFLLNIHCEPYRNQKNILDLKTAPTSKLFFVVCCIIQAQNVPLLLLSYVLLCFKLQHIGLLATVDAVHLQQDQMNCCYSSTVAADTLSLLCFFVSFGGTTSKHIIAAALLFEVHFAINHFAHCIAVQKKIFGFTLMAVTFRGVCAEDKDVSALNIYSVCPCGSLLMLS